VKISFSKSFEKFFKKKIRKNSELEKKFWSKVEIFIQNPFNPILKTHKLSGKLKDYWSFSIDFDLRVVFIMDDNENAIFVDIGSHKEVY
jgi:YafQ family addiction module toxin component